MTDSLKKAKGIVDIEYDSPNGKDMDDLLERYDRGEITYEEFVRDTVRKAADGRR